MTVPATRLVVFNREMHLDTRVPLSVGDTVPVIRGNGPREGAHMGTATVTAVEDGAPVLDVWFDITGETEPGVTFQGERSS